jgi:hypothetical protein
MHAEQATRHIGDSFVSEPRESVDPVTGRRCIQLTAGDCFDYHLYYYIPSMTADGQTVVFYRHQGNEVQLYKLDLETGRITRLTDAQTPNSLWRPWLQGPGHGVRDLLSAFNPVTNEAIYFDSNDIRAVNIHTLADRHLYTVPEDRVPCGLTGVSPDGTRFVFVHADKAWWEANLATGPNRHEARGGQLDLLTLETGKVRTLVRLNTWLTHSNFYDNHRVLFVHPPTENGILMTDLRGGYYQHLRTRDALGRTTCHYQATCKGIMYEAGNHMGGIYDPDTHIRQEYDLGLTGYVHTGHDSEARLWFYECLDREHDIHGLYYFPVLAPDRVNEAVPLIADMTTYWLGQRSHFHPRLTPDRDYILFTGGDATSRSNHLFLLDVADLADTQLRP